MSANLRAVFSILAERESLRLEYSRSPDAPLHAFYSVANSRNNRASNRYSNILAYDRTAIKVDGLGYLNANVVCDSRGGWWVASQAPVPTAFQTFFRAILTRAASSHSALDRDHASSRNVILVQLTGWDENGAAKADRYLPESESIAMGNIDVLCLSRKRLPGISSNLTELLVTESAHSRTVWHYHFEAWPDHGVPDGGGVDALRGLVIQVGRHRDELGGTNGCEVWVHCSAGIGRTGTFIALSSLLLPATEVTYAESPLGPLPDTLKDDTVAQTVDQIREWRGMLVQGPAQLQLLYDMFEESQSET